MESTTPTPETPETPTPDAPTEPVVTPTPEPAAPAADPAPAPAAPVSPFGAALPAAPTAVAAAPKSPKKLIILLASIVGGLIVLVGIALIVFFVFFYVSKQDYENALNQTDNVVTSANSATTDIGTLTYDSGSTTDTVFGNDVSAAQSDLTKLQAASTKLGTLRAMQIGTGKTQYAALNTKLSTYIAYANNYITSVNTARPAIKACADADNSEDGTTASVIAALNSCSSSLSSVGTLKDSDMQTYMTALQAAAKQLASVVNQEAALTDPYGDQFDQLQALDSQEDTAETALTNAETDYESNAQKSQKSVDPSDQINALETALTKQL